MKFFRGFSVFVPAFPVVGILSFSCNVLQLNASKGKLRVDPTIEWNSAKLVKLTLNPRNSSKKRIMYGNRNVEADAVNRKAWVGKNLIMIAIDV